MTTVKQAPYIKALGSLSDVSELTTSTRDVLFVFFLCDVTETAPYTKAVVSLSDVSETGTVH